jgi:hypothetical protein
MIIKFKSIEYHGLGIFSIQEDRDGANHSRTINPDSDISEETAAVKAACQKAWTPEVIAAYRAHVEAPTQ